MAQQLVTIDQLRRITGSTEIRAGQWVTPLNVAMSTWGVVTPKRVAAFLAQVAQETGGLSRFTENLNYSALGLASTWPNRYAKNPRDRIKTPNSLALLIERNPEAIANHTYANRMGNGPAESGDGWRYRGRGPKQITGKANYERYARARPYAVVSSPDMLLIPEIGSDAAGWYWYEHGCSAMIDRDDFKAVSLAINGGLIGYEDGNNIGVDDRVELYANAKQVLGVA